MAAQAGKGPKATKPQGSACGQWVLWIERSQTLNQADRLLGKVSPVRRIRVLALMPEGAITSIASETRRNEVGADLTVVRENHIPAHTDWFGGLKPVDEHSLVDLAPLPMAQRRDESPIIMRERKDVLCRPSGLHRVSLRKIM
jgi:hypothetical protein